jgi:hypothetical protein
LNINENEIGCFAGEGNTKVKIKEYLVYQIIFEGEIEK